jgi:hypothetical protein
MNEAVCGWQAGNDFDDPNSGTAAERTIAQNSVQVLMQTYPGYSWFVEVRGGLLMIRCAELDYRGRYCMVRKLAQVQHDYGRLTREVKHAAGEYLERAGMRRGARRDGETAIVLDGAPKFTPTPGGILAPESL